MLHFVRPRASFRVPVVSGIIQSSEFVGSMLPGRRWHVRNETGPVSTLSYKYRVLCGANYYGRNCTIYCQARNDYHGHYGCDGDGRIYCLSGWTNVKSYCTTRELDLIENLYFIMHFSINAILSECTDNLLI